VLACFDFGPMLRENLEDAAVQNNPHTTLITATAPVSVDTHGGRTKCLQRLVRLDLPVPRTVGLSFEAVHKIARGEMPDMAMLLSPFEKGELLCVRPSSADPDWGGPSAILNIGMNDARFVEFAQRLGHEAAASLYARFVHSYAVLVARLDPDAFDEIGVEGQASLTAALRAYGEETNEPFPQDPAVQLGEVLRSMARAWDGTSARLLRQAKGAPADAGLGLVVQSMALGFGTGECGSGVLQLIDRETGLEQLTGRYMSQSQGRDALAGGAEALFLERDTRGPSLEELAPDAFEKLITYTRLMREKLREEMQVEFVIEDGRVHLLDGVRVSRTSRAAVRIAVRLAEDEIITRQEALMRVPPSALNELLHRQVDRTRARDVIGHGVAASPGAATGRIVFTAADAQAAAARGDACVLVRRETSPEDIRGMHAAKAVLTERGGMTSHAAVIGRGIGLPCVVGATALRFQIRKKLLTAQDGRVFKEGDVITIDGTHGEVLLGAAPMNEATLDDAFQTLLNWADDARDIAIRANADTPADAQTAKMFQAQGIGLCRTEHMFFEADRLGYFREMILASDKAGREDALAKILPVQREDFVAIFKIMEDRPCTIRLLDPPLHEFLPHKEEDIKSVSDATGLPASELMARARELSESNPMLGHRGCRLGISYPEIYEMQARAIFEAQVLVGKDTGVTPVAEIMIPLVSSDKELAILKTAIEKVAKEVGAPDYTIGTMIELPRAALQAGKIADHAAFFSFGTNDLTQTTFGLSRDDAGRFLPDYVAQGIMEKDPFVTLDQDGVGDLILIAAQRGRQTRPDIKLGICGEHGGDPASIEFCHKAGLNYVSCSPYRVPIARLSAAQAAIRDKKS